MIRFNIYIASIATCWSRGIILASGARGPGFNRTSPIHFIHHLYLEYDWNAILNRLLLSLSYTMQAMLREDFLFTRIKLILTTALLGKPRSCGLDHFSIWWDLFEKYVKQKRIFSSLQENTLPLYYYIIAQNNTKFKQANTAISINQWKVVFIM